MESVRRWSNLAATIVDCFAGFSAGYVRLDLARCCIVRACHVGPFIGNHHGGTGPVPSATTIGLDGARESAIVDADLVTALFVDNNV